LRLQPSEMLEMVCRLMEEEKEEIIVIHISYIIKMRFVKIINYV